MASSKLYIYDGASEIDLARQADGRFSAGSVQTLASGSAQELKAGLNSLIGQSKTFKRVVFQTHGGPGRIRFGSDRITADVLRTEFTGFGRLFPNPGKLYFDGWNVADEQAGWEFLSRLPAKHSCRARAVSPWAIRLWELGCPMMPRFGGHTIHLWGNPEIYRVWAERSQTSRFPSGSVNVWELPGIMEKLEAF